MLQMKNSKIPFKTPDEAEAVFYEAFIRCDPEVMAGLWANEGVTCIHPGAGAIVDYDTIVRSWTNIFSNVQRTDIQHTVMSRAVSDELAVHVVAEEMLSTGTVVAVVLATNVYRKFDKGWLMIEHHASQVQNRSSGNTLQ
ncbi:MAG: nuclear transport factor 2 family protein [Gammaproteobacteria bacterium]|nr:nuclear transport factor 2 family protein [Gammaproteobacteria bacterium]